jgi:biopolymer transport protein ExbB
MLLKKNDGELNWRNVVRTGKKSPLARIVSCSLFLVILFVASNAFGWWNEDWQYRRKISFDTTASGADVKENLSEIPILVRLHTGNFNFGNAKDDGVDIRFVSSDDQTLLKYHVEKYDTIDEMAALWVNVPKLSGGVSQEYIYMYYGNDEAMGGQGSKETYDGSQIAVFHFDELEGMPQDSTMNENHAAVFLGGQGLPGVVGNSVMFSGGTDKIILEETPTLNFSNGFTLSAWVRISASQSDARLFSMTDGPAQLVVGIDDTKVYAGITGADESVVETDHTADLTLGSWHHVAVTGVAKDRIAIYVDGLQLSWVSMPGELPDLEGELAIGATVDGENALVGEIDELQIAGVPRSSDWLRAFYASQGSDGGLYGVGAEELGDGGSSMPVFYLGAIMQNITLDGWLVIGCLGILAVASWLVFLTKAVFFYQDEHDNRKFLSEYLQQEELHGLDSNTDRFPNSALFKVYSMGCEKLKECLVSTNGGIVGVGADAAEHFDKTLPNRSINAVKSVMEKGYIEQSKRLSSYMVVLTLAISGGPFLGLLGTVWGVMNTFAAMAAAGEANIMAIAPGVASALATTVVGLIVAIPALFAYNYLTGKMKSILADLTIFVDRFGSRIEEFHGE